MFTAKEAQVVLENANKEQKWGPAVQALIIDVCGENEKLHKALVATQTHLKKVTAELLKVARKVDGLSSDGAPGGDEVSGAAGGKSEEERQADLEAQMDAAAGAHPAATPTPRPRPKRGAPHLSPLPPMSGGPRMGADGKPLSPQEAANEDLMDAAVEAQEAEKRGG